MAPLPGQLPPRTRRFCTHTLQICGRGQVLGLDLIRLHLGCIWSKANFPLQISFIASEKKEIMIALGWKNAEVGPSDVELSPPTALKFYARLSGPWIPSLENWRDSSGRYSGGPSDSNSAWSPCYDRMRNPGADTQARDGGRSC